MRAGAARSRGSASSPARRQRALQVVEQMRGRVHADVAGRAAPSRAPRAPRRRACGARTRRSARRRACRATARGPPSGARSTSAGLGGASGAGASALRRRAGASAAGFFLKRSNNGGSRAESGRATRRNGLEFYRFRRLPPCRAPWPPLPPSASASSAAASAAASSAFPRGAGVRPTPDRVRETLFNWLGQDLTELLDARPLRRQRRAVARGAVARRRAARWPSTAIRRSSRAIADTARTFGATGLEAHAADARPGSRARRGAST